MRKRVATAGRSRGPGALEWSFDQVGREGYRPEWIFERVVLSYKGVRVSSVGETRRLRVQMGWMLLSVLDGGD